MSGINDCTKPWHEAPWLSWSRSRSFLPWVFLVFLSLSGGCATFLPVGGRSLHDEIDGIITTSPLDQVNWGIQIADPQRGRILYSRHSHLKFIPASNMKVLSTATALSLLGPDYRYRTDLLGVGPLDSRTGVLNGDLLLKPSGDPTFSDRFYPTSGAPLDSLAEGLWKAGVQTVTGALVVDASAWDSTSVRGTWEVGDLPAAFAATGGVFAIGEGVLTLEVSAGAEEGAPARVRWWPFLGEDRIAADFVTVHPDSSTRGRKVGFLPESRQLVVKGRVHAGETDTLRISQRDPVRLASAALLQAIRARGIAVRGGLRMEWEPEEPLGPDARYLTGLTSPPMAEIVKAILEPSQNWMAEQVVKTLGAERGEEGSWREGLRVEKEFFTQEVGVDSLDLDLQDGSGLSAKSLITPRAMIRILEFMLRSPHADVFRHALASPGEEDSTLENRLNALEGRVFAKTGTITHVNSLSGFLITDSGHDLIFSIFTNGSGLTSRQVRSGIDEILETVARR